MLVDDSGDFLKNGTGFGSTVQRFVQRVRDQLFPDFNVLPREGPWLVSSTIVLECQ